MAAETVRDLSPDSLTAGATQRWARSPQERSSDSVSFLSSRLILTVAAGLTFAINRQVIAQWRLMRLHMDKRRLLGVLGENPAYHLDSCVQMPTDQGCGARFDPGLQAKR